MKKISAKRREQLLKYNDMKKALFLDDFKKGSLRCFLSNKPMLIPEEFRGDSDDILIKLIDCHHITGERENEHLFDPDVMKPVIRTYHTLYHNSSIHWLINQQWFNDYMNRIQTTHPELWRKERLKLLK